MQKKQNRNVYFSENNACIYVTSVLQYKRIKERGKPPERTVTAMTFEELYKAYRNAPKMYGGTYEVHYKDAKFGNMVCFVEVWTEKRNGVRAAVIEKAHTEQYVDPATITSVKKYD